MDAIYEACLLRFRPIIMTTMAALFGALPLALGGGTGSELRRHPNPKFAMARAAAPIFSGLRVATRITRRLSFQALAMLRW